MVPSSSRHLGLADVGKIQLYATVSSCNGSWFELDGG